MTWKYEIDPAYDPSGRVPGEAIIAAAECDEHGNAVGPRQLNPNYQPSVLAKLLARLPADDFLLSFGAYLRGELTTAAFREVFSNTEFGVLSNELKDALLVVNDGAVKGYALYSSPSLLTDGMPPAVMLRGSAVLALAEQCEGFVINPSEFGSLWLPIAEVAHA